MSERGIRVVVGAVSIIGYAVVVPHHEFGWRWFVALVLYGLAMIQFSRAMNP